MDPYFGDGSVTLFHGDCLDVLRELPDCSVDSVVTDPPYGLANTDPAHVTETLLRWVNGERDYLPGGAGFMGKAWDAFVPPVAVWDDCMRVLKPGGHVLAFAGSRTVDLMTLGLRLAGFEIRDSIAWLYGSGFPKSLDVSKAIDKAAGAERVRVELVGGALNSGTANGWNGSSAHSPTAPLAGTRQVNDPATPDAERWQGWGTALKPAFEPVVVARKPLAGGTVAANVLAHGTGALNIDGCRIEGHVPSTTQGQSANAGSIYGADQRNLREFIPNASGRWPANVVLDESQAAALDEQSGNRPGNSNKNLFAREPSNKVYGTFAERGVGGMGRNDDGGASRFFYVAKAPKSERPIIDGIAHPTVKPLALMRWLCRLVTPPGGTVLEPFAGSGTTVEAALLEGFNVVGIEREPDYLPLIEARIARLTAVRAAKVNEAPSLFDTEDTA